MNQSYQILTNMSYVYQFIHYIYVQSITAAGSTIKKQYMFTTLWSLDFFDPEVSLYMYTFYPLFSFLTIEFVMGF